MTDGTVDSGIEFDLSSLLSVSDVTEVELEPEKPGARTIVQTEPSPQYHELKSRVVEGSPRADFRNSNMALRCQVRRNLERQQFMEQQEEEKRKAQQRQQQQQHSKTIAISSVYHSPEVPPKVLDVKTELSFPTVYHMRSKQQEAVKTFITESDDRQIPAHSMPNLALPGSVDGANFFTNSAPTELESGSAFSTDLDMDLDILSAVLEPATDSDLGSINPTFMQMASLPPQQMFGAGGHLEGLTLEVDSAGAKSSSSCPPVFPSQGQVSPPDNMSEQEQMIWAKDRQKKDNHNMIERRRRYNINDRIKELGTLLPKSYDQEMRQHKGTILKASVDYIKKLKSQVDILQELKEAKQQTDKMNQKLALKVNQMWTVMRQHGLVPNQEEESINPDMMVPPSSVMSLPNNTHTNTTTPTSLNNTINTTTNTTTHQFLLMEDNSTATSVAVSAFSGFGGVHPGFVTSPLTGSHHGDFMEDTGSPVTSDPMLTSAPVSPDHDDNTL